MRGILSCFIALSICQLVEAKANTNSRQLETNKQFVDQHLEEGNYEVVHPFQVRDKKERVGIDTRNYFSNASVHYKQVVIVIRANYLLGTRLKLLLNLNDFVFLNQTQFIKLNANGESPYGKRVENCYYQGTVNGDPASFVALSTCNGIRGIIAFENGTALGIWPLEVAEQHGGRKHPHFLYRVKWTKDASCGALTQLTQHRMFAKRDVRRQTKYVELALIADHHFMKQLNLTQEEGVHYMLEAINIADLMLARSLHVRLAAVYMEMWTDEQRVDIQPDIERTLSQAIEYTTGHIYHVEKDATLVFTGASFASNEVTSATFSSVCTARALGILKLCKPAFFLLYLFGKWQQKNWLVQW
ncbi:Protein UNC-71 [Aphelenchoides avenae]|nr:Protein UNC-71 [Aphelenchus avenae]